VWSPDHSKRIRLLKNLTMRVEVNGKDLGALELPDDPVNTMIEWSQDSQAFYVQVGGNAISGQVIAYAVVNAKLQELRAPKLVAEEFAKHHFCKERGNNLYAIRWQKGSQQLLLMPEVYDTSDCGSDMGFTAGYLAEAATGKILKRYSSTQIEAIQRECWPEKLLDQTPKKADHK